MSTSAGRPPSLSNASVVKLVRHLYNFLHVDVDSVKSLPSYDDRNYYFRGVETAVPKSSISQDGNDEMQRTGIPQANEYVLKTFNSLHTSVNTARGISAVWTYMQSKGFNYTEQLLTIQGSSIASLTIKELSTFDDEPVLKSENGDLSCAVRVMRYIPGELFDKVDKKYLTPRLMHDVGALIGKVDAVLQDGFHNSAIENRVSLDWDLTNILHLRRHLPLIDDLSKRAIAEKILQYFETFVTPRMSSFRMGVLHGDPNGMNIILKKNDAKDDYEIAGLIDFDDTFKTYIVFDLGILLTYIMIENLNPVGYSNPVEFARPMVSGYIQKFPLLPEEVGSLYYLVLGRCCQSAVMGEVSYKAEPWNDYLLTTPKKCWKLIELLLSMNKEDIDKIWDVQQ